MKYFKVWIGYDKHIKINEVELPKALAAHMTGGVALLDNASVSGKSITLIEPDYHRALGFNEGYKFLPEDWEIVNRDCSDYKGYLTKIKSDVYELIDRGAVNKLLE